MTARHLQQPGAVSHSHTRKDYGAPVRVWDNGGQDAGGTLDRYTIAPPRSARASQSFRERDGSWMCLAANSDPRGCSGHETAAPGPHLGKRIHWNDLPPEVQRFARASFLGEYCPKEST